MYQFLCRGSIPMSLWILLWGFGMCAQALKLGHQSAPNLNVNSEQTECSHNRQVALNNYKQGRANLWFFHITHHAGTTIKTLARKNNLTLREGITKRNSSQPLVDSNAFFHDFTESSLPPLDLGNTLPCNRDDFVSMISMRDPMARILSGDGMWHTNSYENTDTCNTDNYGLRKLIGKAFGETISDSDLAFAKQRLEMFDVVLDVGDFSNSIALLCSELGWKLCSVEAKKSKGENILETIENNSPDLYEKWQRRNQPEIELYKHAQMLSKRMRGQSEAFQFLNRPFTQNNRENSIELEETHLKWTCPKEAVSGP